MLRSASIVFVFACCSAAASAVPGQGPAASELSNQDRQVGVALTSQKLDAFTLLLDTTLVTDLTKPGRRGTLSS